MSSQPPNAPRERAAASSEEGSLAPRYRLLFEHNLAGVYCTTLDGTILDCNESLASLLGYDSREEVIRQGARDLYLASQDRQFFIDKLIAEGVLTNSELTLRRKDGHAIHILENVVLLPDDNGEMRIIQGTMVDITERKIAEQALRESEERYRSLAASLRTQMQRLQTVREEERARISRELHDELGQSLTALSLDLHWLQQRKEITDKHIRSHIQSMCKLAGDTIQSVRRICAHLRPAILDDCGLLAAMDWLADEFRTRTKLTCDLALPAEAPDLSSEQTTAVFRIFQESLTNVARHADASRVRASLAIDGSTLRLTVSDDGCGISAEQSAGPQSIGISGMRERAIHWGGRLEITSDPAAGTTVSMHMPIARRTQEADT